jgi:hypothetical protein
LDVQDHSGTPRINPYVTHSMHLHLDLNKALAIPMGRWLGVRRILFLINRWMNAQKCRRG